MSSIDLICPSTIGDEAFALRVTSHREGQVVATFETVVVAVDYGSGAEGPVLPIEVIVTTLANRRAHQRTVYRRVRPAQVILRPDEAGPWRVVVRELGHNRWWGLLDLEVVGSRA